jgi:hypothetical protein
VALFLLEFEKQFSLRQTIAAIAKELPRRWCWAPVGKKVSRHGAAGRDGNHSLRLTTVNGGPRAQHPSASPVVVRLRD